MKTSDTVIKIMPALLAAQKKIKHAIKDATNPHLRNQYATLESVIDACKEPLLEASIIIMQPASKTGVITRLQHVSGEFIETEMELLLTKQDMQGLGSAITYARRYALASLMNISQTDDDGQLASMKGKAVKPVAKVTITPKDTQDF
jgi:hypothetical protein